MDDTQTFLFALPKTAYWFTFLINSSKSIVPSEQAYQATQTIKRKFSEFKSFIAMHQDNNVIYHEYTSMPVNSRNMFEESTNFHRMGQYMPCFTKQIKQNELSINTFEVLFYLIKDMIVNQSSKIKQPTQAKILEEYIIKDDDFIYTNHKKKVTYIHQQKGS